MKDKTTTFKIAITISCFGNLAEFYKKFSSNNRIIHVDNIEFKNTPEQHNSGTMEDTIRCKESELKEKIKEYIQLNEFQGECFSVSKDGGKKTILTEDDL